MRYTTFFPGHVKLDDLDPSTLSASFQDHNVSDGSIPGMISERQFTERVRRMISGQRIMSDYELSCLVDTIKNVRCYFVLMAGSFPRDGELVIFKRPGCVGPGR